MKRLVLAALGGILFSTFVCSSAFAQVDSGPVTERDVTRQPQRRLAPAPESGDIIVNFQTPTRIYFKYPIESVHLDDEFTVKALPRSDHEVEFTGLSPGRTTLTIKNKDGREATWGIVTVVRDPHLVKIYTQKPINPVSGEYRQDNPVDAAGFMKVYCNEIGCDTAPTVKKYDLRQER
jgi:hypothetical protein